MRDSGQLDFPSEQAEPAMIAATPPQVSGAAGGHTLSYQHLATRGATLLGRAVGWDGRRLELAPDLGANVRFADETSAFFRAVWERRAALSGREVASEGHRDPADEPAEDLYGLRGPRSLDLTAAGISTVIWATGFGASIGWLPATALDVRMRPRLPGLHVVGARGSRTAPRPTCTEWQPTPNDSRACWRTSASALPLEPEGCRGQLSRTVL